MSDKREYVMLAHDWDDSISPAGMLWSEKYDGQRFFWDGGISRGIPAREVPYANTTKDKKTFISTGLWTRGGKTIQAPVWWIDRLPNIPLDGEGYAGRGRFQFVESVVREHAPGAHWAEIDFLVFDSPPLKSFASIGRIHQRGWETEFGPEIADWIKQHYAFVESYPDCMSFETVHNALKLKLVNRPGTILAPQTKLPVKHEAALEELSRVTAEICSQGGEGTIIRRPESRWYPKRSWDCLKVKPVKDAEATVIGYQSGKETDKDSRNRGRMGALIVRKDDGLEFSISGFEDAERYFIGEDAYRWCFDNPDKPVPDWVRNDFFPRGMRLTYTYIGLTDRGVPKHANYLRKRED